jgi:hypothetical protein
MILNSIFVDPSPFLAMKDSAFWLITTRLCTWSKRTGLTKIETRFQRYLKQWLSLKMIWIWAMTPFVVWGYRSFNRCLAALVMIGPVVALWILCAKGQIWLVSLVYLKFAPASSYQPLFPLLIFWTARLFILVVWIKINPLLYWNWEYHLY